MIELLVQFLILCLVFGAIYYCIGLLAAKIASPFPEIARVVLLVIFVIIAIRLLLPLAGLSIR